MSRVEQALRRAGNATVLAPGGDQFTGHEAETGRPVLELYPVEQAASVEPAMTARASRAPHAVPAQGGQNRVLPRLSPEYDTKLVTSPGVSPTSVEQYRRLAATLHHLQGEQGLRTLMVTSSVPQEGKTLTVVNLAMTLSESYNRRVLLIDADLRRPSIHDVFGVTNTTGIGEMLRSDSSAVGFTPVSSRLWVLPAGSFSGDPMAALASARMATLLEEAASQFDWILLDAPPVALMADAGLLVRLTRAVVLVIAANSTPFKVVEKVVAEVGRENIIGTVLNRTDDDAVEWSTYYSGSEGRTGYSSAPVRSDALAGKTL